MRLQFLSDVLPSSRELALSCSILPLLAKPAAQPRKEFGDLEVMEGVEVHRGVVAKASHTNGALLGLLGALALSSPL